jgi:hypothetical protein
MIGRRLCCEPFGNPLLSCQPGDYWLQSDGWWHGITPNGMLTSLKGHQVEEHADGTITVTPSILVRGHSASGLEDVQWHGYLERGAWREV